MNQRENIAKEANQQIIEHKVENERLSLGYSRAAWRKVKRCHAQMDPKLASLLSKHLIDTLGSTPEEIAEDKKEKDREWRAFIKEIILNAYPGGKDPVIRNRLLDLFNVKIEAIRKQPIKKVIKE